MQRSFSLLHCGNNAIMSSLFHHFGMSQLSPNISQFNWLSPCSHAEKSKWKKLLNHFFPDGLQAGQTVALITTLGSSSKGDILVLRLRPLAGRYTAPHGVGMVFKIWVRLQGPPYNDWGGFPTVWAKLQVRAQKDSLHTALLDRINLSFSFPLKQCQWYSIMRLD